jgi:hypothetical protein
LQKMRRRKKRIGGKSQTLRSLVGITLFDPFCDQVTRSGIVRGLATAKAEFVT